MKITVNDIVCDVDAHTSVEDLMRNRNQLDKGGVAVAVNGRVVRRQEWEAHILQDLDSVLIINAAYGG